MSHRVFLGRLPDDAGQRDVEKFFRGYGKISGVVIKAGYAFIDFDSAEDADDAVCDLHGREILGSRVVLEHARSAGSSKSSWRERERDRDRGDRGDRGRDNGRRRPVWLDKYGPPTRTKYRVIVQNLSTRVSWQDLKDIVRKISPVTYAEAHLSKPREAIIEFPSREHMESAIDRLNGAEIFGRKIEMVANMQESRSSSESPSGRNRSRSRSRSRSRNRSRSSSRRASAKKDIRKSRRSKKSSSSHRDSDRESLKEENEEMASDAEKNGHSNNAHPDEENASSAASDRTN